MTRIPVLLAVAALLAACSSQPDVKISSGQQVQTKSRSEPVFYNGKTYQLDYSYVEGQGRFAMRVSGMGPKQRNDAVAVATSSLGYFACPEGQRGRMIGEPRYAQGVWALDAHCG